MSFEEFLEYRTNCPKCGKVLTTVAEFEIFSATDKNPQLNLDLGISILYNYDPINVKFILNGADAAFFVDKPLDIELIQDRVVKVFKPVFTTFPDIGLDKLNKLLGAHFGLVSLTFEKRCSPHNDEPSDHNYELTTNSWFNDADLNIEISEENLSIFDYSIFNVIKPKSDAEPFTIITSPKNHLFLPFISLDKWDLIDEKQFTNQLYKYIMLS